jgi:hypothetical protein
LQRPAGGGRLRSGVGLVLILLAGSVSAQVPGAAPPAGGSAGHEAQLAACERSPICSGHLDRANRLYEENSYTLALREYLAAYQLQPYPLILYNIARIHHKQNNLPEAAAAYQRYLDTGHTERAGRARQLLSEAMQELYIQQSMPEPAPAPLVPEPPQVVVTPAPAPVARPERRPVYKKWWFWTLVGVGAAGAATAIGIGVYSRGPDVSGLPTGTVMFWN